jgi:hypothetical protein
MSESTENLKFKIGLSATYFDKKPNYAVFINDKEICTQTVTVDSDETFYIEFEESIDENTENTIFVKLLNKQPNDTVTNDGKIVQDMLLNIESIEIDEIDLGPLVWAASTYVPDHPQKFNGEIIKELKNCVNLGWNGAYSLKFSSPFYIWLLENI